VLEAGKKNIGGRSRWTIRGKERSTKDERGRDYQTTGRGRSCPAEKEGAINTCGRRRRTET